MKLQTTFPPAANTIGEYVNVRVVVIIITLFLAWVLGQSPDIRYLGFSLLIATCLMVMRYPKLGVVGLIISSLLIPIAIGTGTQTQLPLSFIGVPLLWMLWFVGNVAYRQSIVAIKSRITLALLGLIATVSIALISGYLPWNVFAGLAPLRAQLGGWGLFVFSAGALLLTGLHIDSLRWLKILMAMFLISASFLIIGRLLPQLPVINRLFVTAAGGSVFWIWLVVLIAGQLLFNRQLNNRLRIVLVLFLAGAAFVTFGSSESRDWASGWIPPSIALVCLIILRWPRMAFIALCFGVTAAVIGYREIGEFLLSGNNAYSLLTRGAATEILLKIIQADPWLGLGPANYYYYTPLYPILGWYVSFNSHNQYLDIVAQAGVIGLIFYLWTFAELLLLAWKLRVRVGADGFSLGYVNACIAGVIGMLVAGVFGDWVIPFVYNVGVNGFRGSVIGWIFLGGLLSINHIYLKRTEVSTPLETKPESALPIAPNGPVSNFN